MKNVFKLKEQAREEAYAYFDENETGRNESFCDLSTGNVFEREIFVLAIKNGEYPGYTIASIDGLDTPMSKLDGVTSNNLG